MLNRCNAPKSNHVQRRNRGRREEMPADFSACSASSRLRSAWFFPSFGEARRPASAKATAVRRSFSEGGSASGAKAAAFTRRIFHRLEGEYEKRRGGRRCGPGRGLGG